MAADVSLLEAALLLARHGLQVFPCHWPTGQGCSCRLGARCDHAGKHPRFAGWQQAATTDETQIRRWWRELPHANIGVATGPESGIFELDVDPRHGGDDSLAALERTYGKLPDTPEFLTGGGGRGILFRYPEGARIRNRQRLSPGLDIRGDGGLFIAPDSLHASGRRYLWELSSVLGEVPLADAPAWLLQAVREPEAAADRPAAPAPDGAPVEAGLVIAGCPWLQHTILHAATLSEPAWKAQGDLAARLGDGETLFQKWSAPYPGYDPERTAEKFRHCRKSPGPPTCEHIRQQCGGAEHCARCLHRDRVKSPLSLARGQAAALELVAPPESRRIQAADYEEIPLPEDTYRPFPRAGVRPASGPAAGPGEAMGAERAGHSGAAVAERPEPAEPARSGAVGPPGPGEPLTLDQARLVAKDAARRLKDDAGAVYEEQALQALALLRRYDPQSWARLKQQLMRARVSLKELLPQFPAVTLAASDRAHYGGRADAELDDPADVQYAGDMLDDCPLPSLVVPKPYQLRANATLRIAEDDEGAPVPHTIAFAPVLLTGRMRDAVTGGESLLLNWRWPGQPAWQQRVVERSQALQGKKLADLATWGFPVADDVVKPLVGYLHRLEAYNRRQLPCAAVSSHLGWQGEEGANGFLCGRTLVLPDGEIASAAVLDVEHPETWDPRRIAYHGVGDGDEQIVDAFHTRGTFAEWADAVSVLQGFPKALLGLYAAFAAPLLALFNCPNFIIDYSNRTSTGKTTILRVVGSTCGNPDERTGNSVIGTWDATRVWTERASHLLGSLPLCMDDTKKARHPRSVAEVLYAVASGRGRGRGTVRGLAQTAIWRTILFSTGEAPATSFTQDGGTRTRTLEIRGLPFGRADLETGRIVAALNAALVQHYGHAMPRFVQWLYRERERWEEWRAYYRRVVEGYSLRPPSPEAGRLAQYAALVTVAGVMAHRALELPWEHVDPVPTLWDDLAAEAAEASGEVRALQDVVSWAHAHAHTFAGRHLSDGYGGERVPGAVSGRWDPGDNWEYLALFPTVLRGILRTEGYEFEAIVPGWRERGWLQHSKGKLTLPVRLREHDKERPRMVVIRREAIEEAG